MRGGKWCRKRPNGQVLTCSFFLSLLSLFVIVIACGSESPSEPSRIPSVPAPVAQKTEYETGAPTTGGTL